MNNNRSRLLTVYLPALLLVWGCSGEQQGHGGFAMPPMPVEVAPVQSQTVADKFETVGTIDAVESVTIVSEIDATVMRLPFREGAPIKRGELVAKLDDTQLAAELARSEALLAQSRSTYERTKEIVDQRAGTPQDLDDAAAALQVAEANLALAKARLTKTRIVAPFDGMIGARRVSTGAFLRSGQPIADLASLEEIRVKFSAPERYLSQLRRDAEVRVATAAYPGNEVTGKIIVVEPVLDAATRSAGVVAQLKNPEGKFRPGMSANVTVVLAERPNALTIPNEAVFASGNDSYVFVVKPDSSVARVALTLGTRLAKVVEVVQGLEPGMQVVRAGHQKLFDGARVLPVVSQGEASSSADGTEE